MTDVTDCACFALAIGCATKNSQQEIIEAYYPNPILGPTRSFIDQLATIVSLLPKISQTIELTKVECKALEQFFIVHNQPISADFVKQAYDSTQPIILTVLATDNAPQTVAEGFLKLQLLSHRLVLPHAINLTGVFSILKNLAWTNKGPIDLIDLPARQMKARLQGETLTVDCVDKFPKMSDYIVPEGVRIADTARVRLGAYVGEGTTVMHEGFINFNAGTKGVSMVEGRISSGVLVGEYSDIGGGASIMGTLSGGGKVVVSIGEKSLLGANAGLGFPLGDRCTIESGLYVTAGTKVHILDKTGKEQAVVKAKELADKPDLLFRRNSSTGRVECLTNRNAVELNSELHSHN